jgi:iron-regulated transporter 1
VFVPYLSYISSLLVLIPIKSIDQFQSDRGQQQQYRVSCCGFCSTLDMLLSTHGLQRSYWYFSRFLLAWKSSHPSLTPYPSNVTGSSSYHKITPMTYKVSSRYSSLHQELTVAELNSQMRRIDLFCKLIGPLSIALVAGFSTNMAIIVTFSMTASSVFVEYYAIARVYYQVDDLQSRPIPSPTSHLSNSTPASSTFRSCISYLQHPAFLPSFSLSLLYLTVLTFGGQMVTYLLSVGFSSISIGLLRTVSTIFELSSTWLAPKAMRKIGAIRCGIWFLNWQIVWVMLAVVMLWIDIPQEYAVVGLLAGTIASRVGLWGFDLSAQVIVQEVRWTEIFLESILTWKQAVESDQRGSFSATEASVQNIFELLSFASTAIFARPDQFRIPAAVSAAAVVLAGLMYAFFVRQQRGHLFHASKCMQRKRPTWQPLAQDDDVELS